MCFEETIAVEARNWLRQTYGTIICVNDKTEFSALLPTITVEEKEYHEFLNDCVANRMKKIVIHHKVTTKPTACLEVVIE